MQLCMQASSQNQLFPFVEGFFSLGTVLAKCSVTRPALVVNGDTAVIYFTTGHNHFVSSQSYPCHCASLVCTTWHDVIDSHAWLADAQVPTTRHPVTTTTANLLDFALVLIDEGLDVCSCTQLHRFQVSVIRCNKKVSTCSRLLWLNLLHWFNICINKYQIIIFSKNCWFWLLPCPRCVIAFVELPS